MGELKGVLSEIRWNNQKWVATDSGSWAIKSGMEFTDLPRESNFYRVLRVLVEKGPMTTSQLAKKLNTKKENADRAIEELGENSLIKGFWE